jgi:adenylate cyclase, class 2
MPENLELKARVQSLRAVGAAAQRIGARKAGTLVQRDTYYTVRRGRLKLREIVGSKAELIAYDRPNLQGSRVARYDVFPIERPRVLKSMLNNALGTRAVVEKRRTLHLYQNCRIHADQVRGLGTFLEFEVTITRGRPQARRLMKSLVRHFGVDPADVVGPSYCDLILDRQRRRR